MLDFLFPTEKDVLVQFAVALPDITASSCCFITEADRPRVLSLEQKEPGSSAFQSTTKSGPMTRSEQNQLPRLSTQNSAARDQDFDDKDV